MLKGIDISANNDVINWSTVANYGMDFVIIRITERGNKIDGFF
jgi:GH25 family lysozyme M1 (1,4-beta-N-acetylmuramidase)